MKFCVCMISILCFAASFVYATSSVVHDDTNSVPDPFGNVVYQRNEHAWEDYQAWHTNTRRQLKHLIHENPEEYSWRWSRRELALMSFDPAYNNGGEVEGGEDYPPPPNSNSPLDSTDMALLNGLGNSLVKHSRYGNLRSQHQFGGASNLPSFKFQRTSGGSGGSGPGTHIHQHVNLQAYYHKLSQQQQNPTQFSHTPLLRGQYRLKTIQGASPYNCTTIPRTRHNRWMHAVSQQTGLCNQLFGVYSYLAAAFYFNSSLIVGDIYSRTSFDLEWPLPRSAWTSLPFSSFFDWYHFSNYWKVRGVEMIEYRQYEHCPELPERLRPVPLIRYPPSWPFDFATKMKMLAFNNVSNPLPENIVINLISHQNFVTFGFLYEFPALLMDVYQSLQPAPLLSKFIRVIQQQLMVFTNTSTYVNPIDGQTRMPYIAAHLRIENDYYGKSDIPERRVAHRQAIKYLINNNTCLSHWPRDPKYPNRLINPPPLYLSCGLWGKRIDLQEVLNSFATKVLPLIEEELEHYSLQDYTLYLLYEAGFRTIYNKEILINQVENEQMTYIYTKEKREKDILLQESYLKESTSQTQEEKSLMQQRIDQLKQEDINDRINAERFKDYIDFVQYHALFPEQLAMIDLYVSRFAPCFCPAHISSTFSYWIMRMKAFAEHKHLHIAEVNDINYPLHWVFAGWGV